MEAQSLSQDQDNSDLLQHLRDKIRTQASRLRSLEQYRLLCEQRISELLPGHNLPVQPSDLGTGLPPQQSQELQMAKQKISRLEQQLLSQEIKVPLADNYVFPPPSTNLSLAQIQELYSAIYYQHHESIKEKAKIEESLRAEMLICEEQRAYIEILKQALESNMQDLGMSGRSNEEESQKERKDNEDYKELFRLKTEECERMIQERNSVNKHLKEAAEALQYAEEEVERLEEEKSALLDYIDEQDRRVKDVSEEGERAKRCLEEVESKWQGTISELSSVKNAKKELEAEVSEIRNESSKNEIYLEGEFDKLKEIINSLNQKLESSQENNTILANTLKETQGELDSVNDLHMKSSAQESAMREENTELNLQLAKASEAIQVMSDEKAILELKLSKFEKETKALKDKMIKELEYKAAQDQFIQEIEELKAELEKAEEREQELRSLFSPETAKENKELKVKLQKTLDESQHLQKMLNQVSFEVSELKKTSEAGQIELRQVIFEKDKLNSDLQHLSFNLNSEKNSKAVQEDESAELRSKISENSKQIKQLNEALRDRDNKISNAEAEIENFKRNIIASLQDIEAERSKTSELNEEYQKLKRLYNSLSSSEASIDSCKRLIADFSKKSAENSILSHEFLEILFKSSEIEHVDVTEWVSSVCEEFDCISTALIECKKDYAALNQKFVTSQHKLDNLMIDESALRDRERSFRVQIENLSSEKLRALSERETLLNKLQSSQNEVSDLKAELKIIIDESQRLKDQLNYTTSDTIQWRHTVETDSFTIKAIEEKANLLRKEKKDLEMLITKLQSAVPLPDLQRVFLDLMKCHSDLEAINREKLKIDNHLLRAESELRSLSRQNQQERSVQLRKEVESLRSQITSYDSQILSYKRRMLCIEEEMREIERSERKRLTIHIQTEKHSPYPSGLEYKSKEIYRSQGNLFDSVKKQESVEKHVSFMTSNFYDTEDKSLLTYIDKLKRAKEYVSGYKDLDN